jgi:hypothetical protein
MMCHVDDNAASKGVQSAKADTYCDSQRTCRRLLFFVAILVRLRNLPTIYSTKKRKQTLNRAATTYDCMQPICMPSGIRSAENDS